ncbi:MAG: Antitoxin of toxin-antitoxin system StbD [Rickettsiaceae bacterium]|jgi:prevent-host-death family protein|nr:Antitoxin of toxin-antitoxin system StbD [Rickettsiaceae bacterium]
MTIINSREAQSNFGELMIKVIREPVIIQKHGKTAAVLISPEDFEKFQKLEELYWALKVEAAEKNGYLSTQESDDLLNNILKG